MYILSGRASIAARFALSAIRPPGAGVPPTAESLLLAYGVVTSISPSRAAAITAWSLEWTRLSPEPLIDFGLAQTKFTPGLVVPAAIVSVLVLFAGGLLFAFLRLRTGNLAAAFMAHWWFDAGLVLGLYALARI